MSGSIGKITAPVNGFHTATEHFVNRSNYREMLSEIVQRIEERLIVVGISASAASQAAGLSKDAIRNLQRAVKAGRGGGVNVTTIAALSGPLQTTSSWLLRGETVENERDKFNFDVRMVPLVGEVRAGAFVAIADQFEPDEFIPFADPQWSRAELFAVRVIGKSMNLIYEEGAVLICANAVESGVREGDHVVLKRFDGQGRVETTLKEISTEAGKIEFWPRSTETEYQVPFVVPLKPTDTQEAWEVIGVVVAEFRKRAPRGGRLVHLPVE